jgi:hypothetical protein
MIAAQGKVTMSGFFNRLRNVSTAERLAPYGLRPDTVAAAQTMVSDPRTDPQIVALESSLLTTETVLRMMDGRYNGERGLLVLTDIRVFFRSRRSKGPVDFGVQLADVETIEGSTHKAVGTVRVTSPDGVVVVGEILGNQGEQLATDARNAIDGKPVPRLDPVAALADLRAQRESGAITAAEFEARKAELWGQI